MREASRVGERDLSGGAARANDFATRVGSYTDRNNYSALRLDSPNLR